MFLKLYKIKKEENFRRLYILSVVYWEIFKLIVFCVFIFWFFCVYGF